MKIETKEQLASVITSREALREISDPVLAVQRGWYLDRDLWSIDSVPGAVRISRTGNDGLPTGVLVTNGHVAGLEESSALPRFIIIELPAAQAIRGKSRP